MEASERVAQGQEALRTALAGLQASIWTSLPGIVQSFDPEAVTVVVQPTIKGVQRMPDGSSVAVDLPLLPDVPVFFPRGGGVTLTFPVKPGNECIVVFASRCIDGWWQSGESQLAPELRMHDLSDGFALIGPQSQAKKISNISTTAAQLRTDDGENYVEMTAGGVVNGKARAWNLTGPVHIDGPVTTTSSIKAQADVIGGGISLDGHTHRGDSGGSTSAPR